LIVFCCRKILNFIILILIFIISCVLINKNSKAGCVNAVRLAEDNRFLTWMHYPNTVYCYTGYYLYPAYIEFESSETVSSISTPKPTAWQFIPNSNRLFIKPVEDDADTTMILMTNKRIYYFEIYARYATLPTEVPFYTIFRYTQENLENPEYTPADNMTVYEYDVKEIPDLTANAEKYNFNYTVSGDDDIAPLNAFDDGKFIFLEFRRNGIHPAIFRVSDDKTEGVVNMSVVGPYTRIDGTSKVFTLRYGEKTACLYNEQLGGIKKTK
jgi:type IV secretion system protein VirB9